MSGSRLSWILVPVVAVCAVGFLVVVTRGPGEEIRLDPASGAPPPLPDPPEPGPKPQNPDPAPGAGPGSAEVVRAPDPPAPVRPRVDLAAALGLGTPRDSLSTLQNALAGGASPGALALDAVRSGRPHAQISVLLEEILKSGRCKPVDFALLAEGFVELGLASGNKAYFERALLLDPDNLSVVEAYLRSDPVNPADFLVRVNVKRIRDPEVLETVLRFLEAGGGEKGLYLYANRLIALEPTNRTAVSILTALDPEMVENRFAELARARPDDPRALATLGSARLAAQRREEAFAAFERAAALDPADPDILQGLIEADPARAVDVLRGLAREHPGQAELQGKLGRALAEAGRPDDAFTHLWSTLVRDRLDPEWMDLLLELDAAKTAAGMREWAARESKDDAVQGLLGRALLAVGDRAGAFTAYARAFALAPIPAWAHGMAEGDPRKAAAVLGTALGLTAERLSELRAYAASLASPTPLENPGIAPSELPLLGEGGYALTRAGELTDGAALLEIAIRSRHLEGEQLSVLTGALGTADPQRARALLREWEAGAGYDAAVWGRIGHGYRALGSVHEALSAFRRARALDPTNEEWIGAVRELERR